MKRGFACGVFDLFHAGHVLMLKECKENCDYLIIALNKAENLPPEKNRPIFPIDERIEIMEACKYVDKVITYNSEAELENLLKELDIDVRFLGEDYKNRPITGSLLDIEIHYTDRSHGYSTTEIRKRILDQTRKHN